MSKEKAIHVKLTIKDNPTGTGNCSNRHYDYIFDPDLVHVTERPQDIIYRLAEEDQSRFEMAYLYSTDSGGQLSKPVISPDGNSITVTHGNTEPVLIVVSVRVKDRARSQDLNCDPQVTNDPPPVF